MLFTSTLAFHFKKSEVDCSNFKQQSREGKYNLTKYHKQNKTTCCKTVSEKKIHNYKDKSLRKILANLHIKYVHHIPKRGWFHPFSFASSWYFSKNVSQYLLILEKETIIQQHKNLLRNQNHSCVLQHKLNHPQSRTIYLWGSCTQVFYTIYRIKKETRQ